MAILIGSRDVKSLFEMEDFVEAVEECYKLLGLGLMKRLPRTHLDAEHTSNFLSLMPCTVNNLNVTFWILFSFAKGYNDFKVF
jgi:hypothetical protein